MSRVYHPETGLTEAKSKDHPNGLGAVLDADDARKLTERIRYTALSVRDGMEKLQRLVQEAKDGNAHEALGYPSWTAYLADVLGSEPLRLPRDQRQELVGYLAGEGMSTRAIAPIVGVTRQQVSNDLQVASHLPPAIERSIERGLAQVAAGQTTHRDDLLVNRETGEILDDPTPAEPTRPKVTGLDGKTYSRPEPKAPSAPKRRALPDQFFEAAYDMGKAIEKVARLTEDDRFPQNAEKVAAKHRNDLLRARDLLDQVINSLPTEEDTNA